MNGLSIGAWLVIGPLYASEVAPLKLRGWLTAMTNIIQFSGVLVFTGIMYKLGPQNHADAYIIPFACQWIVPCVMLLTVWFWPESPVWLVRTGRIDAAKRSLRRLHGAKSASIDPDAILALIRDTAHTEQEHRVQTANVTYADCFAAVDRKRTLICMFVYGCQYLSGIIFVLGYQSYYYQLTGFDAKMSFLLGMLNNCSMFVANILSWSLIGFVGRRPLIVWGQFACALTLLIVGGASVPGRKDTYLVTIAFMFVWVRTVLSRRNFGVSISLDLLCVEFMLITSADQKTGVHLPTYAGNGGVDCRGRDPVVAASLANPGAGQHCARRHPVAGRLRVPLHV